MPTDQQHHRHRRSASRPSPLPTPWTRSAGRRGRLVAAVLTLAAVASACGNAATTLEPTPSTTSPDATDMQAPATLDLEAVLTDWVAHEDIVGAVAAISVPGQPLHVAEAGWSERETQDPTSARHSYRIGSITKLFTAALVLDLVEDGVVELDDPATDYLPGADPAITIRHLLNHTSGLAELDVTDDIVTAALDPSTVRQPNEVVEAALKAGVSWPPGSRTSYSSLNYLLLGEIIEAATANSYESAVRERVLGPLNLNGTGFEDDDTVLATPYERLNPATGPLPLGGFPTDVVVRASGAAGGLVSTPTDLATFISALFDGRLLSPDTLELMLEGTTNADTRYGLGPAVYDTGPDVTYGHNGRTVGFAASVRHDPNTHVTVVVLANDGSAPTPNLANQLIDTARDGQ